jgi:hypothetical protein
MPKFERSVTSTQRVAVPAPGGVWRRLHDGNIIAEVVANPGFGVWRASAYRITARQSEVAYTGRAFSLLTEAHQGADELARREFGHECRTGTCGQWLRWRQAESGRR